MYTTYYENADKIWANKIDSGNVAKLWVNAKLKVAW